MAFNDTKREAPENTTRQEGDPIFILIDDKDLSQRLPDLLGGRFINVDPTNLQAGSLDAN